MTGIHPVSSHQVQLKRRRSHQFIEALKEKFQNMGWNLHPKSGITTISYGNGIDLNLFDNYGQLRTSDITIHATTYINEDTGKIQK